MRWEKDLFRIKQVVPSEPLFGYLLYNLSTGKSFKDSVQESALVLARENE